MPETALGVYGAFLSSLVFSWQLWRSWRERRLITASYNFRGIDDPGNEIILINHSPTPITIYHAQPFWGRRYPFYMRRYRRVGMDEWHGMETDTGFTIEPFKIFTLHYMGERHFDWPYKRRPAARLYLEARIVGRRRPLTLFVYRPDMWTPGPIRRIIIKLGALIDGSYIDEASRSGSEFLDLAETLPAPPST